MEAAGHSEAPSTASPPRLVAVDLSKNRREAEKKEFKLSMVEINKKERKEGQDQAGQPTGPEESVSSAPAPMLQEFGPLKTCAFPIDPDYAGLDAKEQNSRPKDSFQRKARSLAPALPSGTGGAVRASPEDERVIHTQLIPTSYPIPASTLLEKRSSGSRPPSKPQANTLDISVHLLSFAAPPSQSEEARMSPRLQQMKATPKFKQNERQRVKNQLQASKERAELQDVQKFKVQNQNQQATEWFKPFPQGHGREDRDSPREAGTWQTKRPQPGQGNLEQTQLKVKEYWLPLGQMPQDREYIEVLDNIVCSLTSGQQVDAKMLQESSFLDSLVPHTADGDRLVARRQPSVRSPRTAPRIGATNPFDSQKRSRRTSDLDSTMAPELPRVGIGSGLSMPGRTPVRWRPPTSAEYQAGESEGPGPARAP